jgi:lipopolysaccharide/colanic/teichoic acid biosynthesis glycosyltransferase
VSRSAGPRKLTPHQVAHARRLIENVHETQAGATVLPSVNEKTLWQALKAVL